MLTACFFDHFVLNKTPDSLFLPQVRITLESVDMEKSAGCVKDSLSFYDGEFILKVSCQALLSRIAQIGVNKHTNR